MLAPLLKPPLWAISTPPSNQAKLLIASVKALIANVYDSKTASTVENNIIKLIVKYHFLVSSSVIEEDAWLAMDGGLREAFKW